MANLRSFLAPIHKLPTEVLTRIFIENIHDTEELYNPQQPRRRLPFVLSTVCRRWRDISLSFPGLWSHLRVLDPDWDAANITEILDCYIARSQTCSLTVELEIPQNMDILRTQSDEEADDLCPVLEGLVEHSARWEHLKILGCAIFLLDHPVFHRIKGHLPALHHLEILQTWPADIRTDDEYDIFSDCPQLRTVDTEWPPYLIHNGSLLQQLQLPWSQINSWTIDIEEWSELLSRPCDSLEHLEIDDIKEEEPDSVSENEEVLTSKVSSLKLVGPWRKTATYLSDVLDTTSFPQLRSLELCSFSHSWSTPFLGCLTRSSCTITCLTLQLVSDTDRALTDDEIMSLLRHTPSVHTFSLVYKLPLSKEFLKSFALSHAKFPAPSPILPMLENFSLGLRDHIPKMDDKAIVDALASRWLPDPDYAKSVGAVCLRSVTIEFPANRFRTDSKAFFQPDMPSLHDLRAAGMRIDVIVSD
ncbi:hypothetical protein V5O48_012220 [Marasmius crinis-equi]|uniref:F-box domain-containing protein n=1 Tax=Marasmius crinis-equi TaxID=585013 RepID=A0ABR3F3E0_9AGAR